MHNNGNSLLQLHQSPPSIPSGDFRYGYKVDDETHNMISLKQLFNQKLMDEGLDRYIGPGYYEVSDSILTRRRGGAVPYAQDSSRRTLIEAKSQSKVVGPGTYDNNKTQQVPFFKYDPNHLSSMFASNTKRSTSVEPANKDKIMKVKYQLMRLTKEQSRNLMEGSNSQKQISQEQINREASAEKQIQEFENTQKSKSTPGPGAYFDKELLSSFRKVTKDVQYQFFGSCEERFQDKSNLDALIKQKLGPGFYHNEGNNSGNRGRNENMKKQPFKTVAFNSEQNRFLYTVQEMPGPGTYQNVEDAFQKLKSQRSHNKIQQTFGSIEKRFAQQRKLNPFPGPGEYKPERSLMALSNMKNEIMPESAAFKSKDSERKISEPILHNSPPVGTYNPCEKPGNALKSGCILTMRPGYKDKEPVPFNSEAKRFSNQQASQFSGGPGTYDPPSIFEAYNAKKNKKGASKLFAESRRFEKHGSYLDNRQLPGPGSYVGNDHDSLSAKKKSFNFVDALVH